MKQHASVAFAFALLGLVAGTATAQIGGQRAPDETPLAMDSSQIIGREADGKLRGYVFTGEPAETVLPGAPPSRILFVNNCKGETTSTGGAGCRITRGNSNNSLTNTSTIASGNLAAYSGSTTTWNSIMTCVRQTFAPFGITVVDVNPGNVPHFEAMAAGLPTQIGFSNGVAGVAPFTCGIINNAISFSFLNLNPSDVNDACWTIAQESAHAFGLSHEMLAADPMTYIPNPPVKRFVDQSACIGTQGCCQPAQECQCGPTMQNSYQELLDIFGPSNPTPPTIVIETPTANSQVTPGFVVRATVTDPEGVESVQLLIDGTAIATLQTPPYAFNAPMTLAQGTHMVTIRAFDATGSEGTATVSVIVGDPCNDNGDCSAQGSDLVCVDGRCVAGSNTPGGLGSTCTAAIDCLSGQCATKDGENKCVESCDTAADGCPDGFSCLSNGAGGGLCWPGGGGCLGCSTDGSPSPTGPIGAGILLAAVLVRRRGRKAR
jgi:MYXO-CTERM domain-containing protein